MSETFDAAWLSLRESVDHRSRSVDLMERLHAWVVTRGAGVSIVDLGSGTGSNLRYLAPRLPAVQSWLLVDHDEELLGRVVSPRTDPVKPGQAPTVSTRVMDLANVGPSEIDGADIVTASALLDLVSSIWIESLADTCATARCAALLALTFDGTMAWGGAPVPGDDLIHEAVNAHQRREKGLGAALGPDAGAIAAEAFQRRGFQTFTGHSPWKLGPGDGRLASALVEGWVGAAVEQRPADESRIREWARRRERSIGGGDFELTVGHVDVLALPSPGSHTDSEP